MDLVYAKNFGNIAQKITIGRLKASYDVDGIVKLSITEA